jgi:hypothetical protein
MALAVVAAANNGDAASHALAQALQFAAAVAAANARHPYSSWTDEDEAEVATLASNPDLVAALGGCDALTWLATDWDAEA